MSNLYLVLIVFCSSIALLSFPRVRPDLVALLALLTLTITGAVSTEEAWSGFGNPAVSTIWIMFVIAAGLHHTGVSALINRYLLSTAGLSETSYIILVMLIAAGLSAFMNNAPCAALLLPIFLELSRSSGISPSKILMPMSFSILIGGLFTLIGTPTNLIAANVLESQTNQKVGFLALFPVTFVLLIIAILLLVPIFKFRKVPKEDSAGNAHRSARDLIKQYKLSEHCRWYRVTRYSKLVGQTLEKTYLRRATQLTLLAIQREDQTKTLPRGDDLIQANDLLLLYGEFNNLEFLECWQGLEIKELNDLNPLSTQLPIIMSATIFNGSELAGKKISQTGLSSSFNSRILSIIRNNQQVNDLNVNTKLEVSDQLLLILSPTRVSYLVESGLLSNFQQMDWSKVGKSYEPFEQTYLVKLPSDIKTNRALNVVTLKAAFSINVIAIQRQGESIIDIRANTQLMPDDQLVIMAAPSSINSLLGLQNLTRVDLDPISSIEDALGERFELVEFTISPRASLAGEELRGLNFSKNYGATVLACWRSGETVYQNFSEYRLQHGDALLLICRSSEVSKLRTNPDLVALSQFSTSLDYKGSAKIALVIVGAMLVLMFTEVLDIPTAALLAATAMILFKCITMEQAFRSIDWKSVLLIAGFWPLGIAMTNSGLDDILSGWLLSHSQIFGAFGLLAVLYIMTNIFSAVVPSPTLVLLFAPIAIKGAEAIAIAPQAGVFAVTIAASACFWSPIAHPVNAMVMGPGKYTFIDFIKAGLPLTILGMLSSVTILYFFYL